MQNKYILIVCFNCNFMKKIFLFLILISFINGYSQISSLKKDSISINDYIKSQKSKNKNPDILVINDKKWVDIIKNYSNSKQKLKADEFQKKLKKKTIVERFINDDKSVDQDIISIIKKGDIISIKSLYDGLSTEVLFNKERTPKNINLELKSLFFESINNPELELSAASMISSLKIDGFEKIISDRLLTGKSTNELSLFYCLSDANISKSKDYSLVLQGIDYFINSVINTNKYILNTGAYSDDKNLFKQSILSKKINNMIFLAEKENDEKLKEKLLNFCVQLLNKYPITIMTLTDSNLYGNQMFSDISEKGNQLDILNILVYRNDLRALYFLKLIKELSNTNNFQYLNNFQFDFLYWKFGENISDETLNKFLTDYQYYVAVIYELDKKGILFNDDNLMIKVLSNYEKTPTRSGDRKAVYPDDAFLNQIKDIMTVFYKLDKSKFSFLLNNSIKKYKDDKDLFLKLYEEFNRSSIFSYLLNQKLQENTSSIYPASFLFDPGIYLNPQKIEICNSFKKEMDSLNYKIFKRYPQEEYECCDDTSTSRILLNVLKNNSDEEMKKIEYFLDSKSTPKKEEDSDYSNENEINCYLLFNNVVYFMKLKNSVNDEDMIFNNLSQKLLNSIGSSNRFVKLDFWKDGKTYLYSFGNPEVIESAVNKYDFKN